MAVKSIYNDGIWELRPKAVTANSATTILDLTDSQSYEVTLEADTLFQLDNPLKGPYTIHIINNGNHHISWPSNVYFPDGVAPPVTTRDGASDIFTLIYDGTDFYASSSTELLFPLLLEKFGGGVAAGYSLRNLSYDSIGQPVVRVRRSSDDAQADFTAYEVADGPMLAWVGANDGFVTTWYDQSGNGNDVTQATAGNQPKIVDAGSVILENGTPVIDFSAAEDLYLDSPTVNMSIPETHFAVAEVVDQSSNSFIYDSGDVNQRRALYYDSSELISFGAGSNISAASGSALTKHLFSAIYNDNNSFLYEDGVLVVSGDTNNDTRDIIRIGADYTDTNGHDGYIQEYIIYSEVKSDSDRVEIQNDINGYYNIY